jgi:hypothetical protein
MSRTIVIGDVHGCIDELRDLLDYVKLASGDRVVFVGDLIDRGPDPAAVVALAKSIGAESVIGNHEEKALRWRKHETRRKLVPNYKNPMPPIDSARLDQWSKIPDEHWDWIATWPTYLHLGSEWTAVHAGCLPDLPVEKQATNDLMRLRCVKPATSPGPSKYKMASILPNGDQPTSTAEVPIQHWSDLWPGPRKIVYGHYVWPDTRESPGLSKKTTCGIDTGCVFGGSLTAMILHPGESRRICSIKAHRAYAPRLSSED